MMRSLNLPGASAPLHERWAPALVLAAAPAVSGARPPWAWGFLTAFLCLCAIVILLRGFLNRERGWFGGGPLAWVVFPGLALLIWASGTWFHDLRAGAGERFPVLGQRSLVYLWGLAAAFVVGWEAGGNARSVLRAFQAVALAGAVYGGLCILQAMGVMPSQFYGFASRRITGFYTNPNRHAVLLGMSLGCALALFAVLIFAARRPVFREERWRHRLGMAVWLAVVLFICAGAALSLSRMTVLSMALGLGLAALAAVWKLRQARTRQERVRSVRLRQDDWRAQRQPWALASACAVPFVAVVASVLLVSGPAFGRRLHVLPEEAVSRAALWNLGGGLIWQHPAAGWGLGSFESIFTVNQPLEFEGRYAELHNDWLQVGFELGIPAMLAALVAGLGFFVLLWKGLKSRDRFGFWLKLGGGFSVFVALVCSFADFPLREPANGALCFFLAGMAASAAWMRLRTRRLPPGVAAQVARITAGSLLSAGFLAAAYFGFRFSLAMTVSPWLGWVYDPPVSAADADEYRKGLAILPESPELLLPYGQALVQKLRTAPEEEKTRAQFETAVLALIEINPRDYHSRWLKACAGEATGDYDGAAAALEEAADLAPGMRHFREHAIALRVRQACRLWPWAPEREAHLSKALAQMRMLSRLDPNLEAQFARQIAACGARPEEIVRLYPESAVLKRARIWTDGRLWPEAEEELGKAGDTERQTPWFAALQGRVDFAQGRVAEGLKSWNEALENPALSQEPELESWLAEQLRRISPDIFMQAVQENRGLSKQLVPGLAAASRLRQMGKPLEAYHFASKLVDLSSSAAAYRELAESAAAIGDFEGARRWAQKAYDLSNKTNSWRGWLQSAQKRWARPPAKKP